MKTIPDFSDIFTNPFIINCNAQRCCVLLVLQQQNAVALILRILPYKAKRQQSSLRIFSQLPNPRFRSYAAFNSHLGEGYNCVRIWKKPASEAFCECQVLNPFGFGDGQPHSSRSRAGISFFLLFHVLDLTPFGC